MHKLIFRLVATAAIFISVSAHAAVCPAVEFAELQTYTFQELETLADTYIRRAGTAIGTPEFTNCFDQAKRVGRIQYKRFEDRVPPPLGLTPEDYAKAYPEKSKERDESSAAKP